MRILFYDVGNVFVQADHGLTHEHLVHEYGIPRERAELFFRNPEYTGFSRGSIDESAFHQALVSYLRKDLSLEQVRRAHDIHLFDVNQEVLRILGLSQHKVATGIVTNTNPWQEARVCELVNLGSSIPPSHYFRSHEMGMVKTDDGFWPQIAVKTGIAISEMGLIDDNVENITRFVSQGGIGIGYTIPSILEKDLRSRGLI